MHEISQAIHHFFAAELPAELLPKVVASSEKQQAFINAFLSLDPFSLVQEVDKRERLSLLSELVFEVGQALPPRDLAFLFFSQFFSPILNKLNPTFRQSKATTLATGRVVHNKQTRAAPLTVALDHGLQEATHYLVWSSAKTGEFYSGPIRELKRSKSPKVADPIDLSVARAGVFILPRGKKAIRHEQLSLAFRLVRCFESIALADKVLFTTIPYLSTRKQYNATLNSFQVIQHRAATLYSELVAVRALADRLLQTSADKISSSLVTALALETSRSIVPIIEGCLQLQGGIGFTWENSLHFYLRRAHVLRHDLELSEESKGDFLKAALA